MNISINPTYYCNFRCNFCYLTKNQLSDKSLLDLNRLEDMLVEVMSFEKINHVDLYGGEIGLLPIEYVEKLIKIFKKFNITDVNLNTNLSMINFTTLNDFFHISVSFDFNAREMNEKVWNNMFLLNKPFSILMLASDALLKEEVDDMISKVNLLTNLKTVEIKPYSKNQSNDLPVSYDDFEKFVRKWIESPIKKNFDFINEWNLLDTLEGKRNAFSNDHVYITPFGKFAVLEFDLNDREYFKELNSFDEYLQWSNSEHEKNVSGICKSCDYYGKCLTEHYRYVNDLKNGCNGFKGLIDWYKNERMES